MAVAASGCSAGLTTEGEPGQPTHRLTGFAELAATTYLPGPTSGQMIEAANGVAVPFENQQPVQGVSSAVAVGPDLFIAVSDNGFGAPENSADYLLRTYEFRVALDAGGRGSLEVVGGFTLSDPDRHLLHELVADLEHYPGTAIPVHPAIREQRLLTGADLDPESIQPAPDGGWWFGDELGPFLIRTDSGGRVVAPPVSLPGPLVSPQHPLTPDISPTVGRSAGFEALATAADGHLLAMLEKPVLDWIAGADAPGELRLFRLDPESDAGERIEVRYRLDSRATAATDLVHLSDELFVAIERDDGEGAGAAFKQLFLVDLGTADAAGFAPKYPLVDLLAIPDPDGIASADNVFSFPFQTPETVIVLGPTTLAVVSDNNYPFGNARSDSAPDGTEWIRIEFDRPIAELATR